MSTVNIRLGHEQKFRVDGVVMNGTRDVEVSIDTKQFDVTAWNHLWTSTLPVGVDVTIRALIYWQADFGAIWSKFKLAPPKPVKLQIDGVGGGNFLPVEFSISSPLGQVLTYDVTFKLWDYQ